jgi:hypothetical protein
MYILSLGTYLLFNFKKLNKISYEYVKSFSDLKLKGKVYMRPEAYFIFEI